MEKAGKESKLKAGSKEQRKVKKRTVLNHNLFVLNWICVKCCSQYTALEHLTCSAAYFGAVNRRRPLFYRHLTNASNFLFLNDQPDALIIQIYSVIKFYMFRASSLPIIRSFLPYIRHW